jgi:hypothetical protein
MESDPGYPRAWDRAIDSAGRIVLEEGPSWIGIGAQRCGTTWFTDLLVQHPQMDVARGKKEHHWLYRYGLTQQWDDEARADYRSTFASDSLKIGEFTPYYMRAGWMCELTADALPEDAPILVLVRDPIDRFASALRHEMRLAAGRYRKHMKASGKVTAGSKESRSVRGMRMGIGSGTAKLKTMLSRESPDKSGLLIQGQPKAPPDAYLDRTWLRFVGSDASWGGMYAAQLDAWTAALPESRFIVIQYEKLRTDPQRYTDLVWERLGLESIPLVEIERRSRSSTEGETWIPDDYPHVVRALQSMYRPDAERLAERFDIDLGLWTRTMA